MRSTIGLPAFMLTDPTLRVWREGKARGPQIQDVARPSQGALARDQASFSRANFRPIRVGAIDDDAAIDELPAFFEDTTLKFAESLLAGTQDGLAIINANERNLSGPERYSWQDLREFVRHYADALTVSGLKEETLLHVWM
ncbi:uncharacterized protein A1O5_08556 [Cladophialophora psammophila CBS 110553]|uniref:AMP-dependent synthetase/ligase domain-containing protein n=1 Tax=Cladophialophora psammophila CBS 110553 TaxID=1182543 RepID=W9WIJ5_9EURO|nr:uncharacterized protein A1O5_08556 [Cladophialophora psammophila CBS 110553]EXJ67942.1 hypothetical protein A1O5_08556 [Cladophialophora psammophila CBS 110553]